MIHVIDTPGIFDTRTPEDEILMEITKCVLLTSPGPHAFLMVLSVRNRFSQEERESIEKFVSFFGKDIFKYFIVLFTGKDDLERNELSEEEYISKVPDPLKEILRKCNNRYIFFDNFATEEKKNEQVQCLLDLVKRNIGENGSYYSNADFKAVEKAMQDLEKGVSSQSKVNYRGCQAAVVKDQNAQIIPRDPEDGAPSLSKVNYRECQVALDKEQNAQTTPREHIRQEIEDENQRTFEKILKIIEVVGEFILRGLALYLNSKASSSAYKP
ncbi:GTPase IMAP family member 4-like [Saccostrea cucullata]|uniref:GTPase IMAP family member 4-like n=1 Tax=Saccostrea cuccullata TaxID=36930 RepID=UPI002ED38FAD